MKVEAGVRGALPIVGVRVTGERDEESSAERGIASYGLCHLVPAHAGKADVAQHDVGSEHTAPLDPPRTVVRDVHGVALQLEHRSQAGGAIVVVVDDEDSARTRGRAWIGFARRGRRRRERQRRVRSPSTQATEDGAETSKLTPRAVKRSR